MESIKKIPLLPLLAYLFFVLFWGAGRFLGTRLEEFSPFLATLSFYLVAILPFGIIVPLKVAKKLDYKLHEPTSTDNLKIGSLIFVMILLIGAFSTNAYTTLVEDPSALGKVIRSLLLNLPFGLAVCLNILFLIPRAIQTHLDRGLVAIVVPAIACGLAMGIGWMFDSLLGDFDAVMVMLIFGTLFGFGAALTRSLYITFAAFSLVLVINVLGSQEIIQEPLAALLLGFGLTSAVLVLTAAKKWGYF